MKISKKTLCIFGSFVLSTVQELLFVVGFHMLQGNAFGKRVFTLLGGDFFEGGYIQWATFFAFYWALGEIFIQRYELNKQKKFFTAQLLPTKDRYILMPQDINSIYVKTCDYENKKGTGLLTSLIKKACLKFRSTNSVGEMIEIISIQTEIDKEKSESSQSNIRYLTWLIPSLGFIGTVLGISQSLQIANSGDMNLITQTLGVAFDTTLLALVLSVVVMWFFHALQEQSDLIHGQFKEYVIENLVNRIEQKERDKAVS